jgi:hypothetical protein
MIQLQCLHRGPAGIHRAARRLAQKRIARERRLARKAQTAKTFRVAQEYSWADLMASACSRPFPLMFLPFWLAISMGLPKDYSRRVCRA